MDKVLSNKDMPHLHKQTDFYAFVCFLEKQWQKKCTTGPYIWKTEFPGYGPMMGIDGEAEAGSLHRHTEYSIEFIEYPKIRSTSFFQYTSKKCMYRYHLHVIRNCIVNIISLMHHGWTRVTADKTKETHLVLSKIIWQHTVEQFGLRWLWHSD